MVIGTLGVGKSTVLNRIAESNVFFAKDQVERCTTDFGMHEAQDFCLLDTPGLNDPDMTTVEWAGKLNASEFKGRPVAFVMMCLKACIRPSAQDRTNV